MRNHSGKGRKDPARIGQTLFLLWKLISWDFVLLGSWKESKSITLDHTPLTFANRKICNIFFHPCRNLIFLKMKFGKKFRVHMVLKECLWLWFAEFGNYFYQPSIFAQSSKDLIQISGIWYRLSLPPPTKSLPNQVHKYTLLATLLFL